jgi:pilus assembly protein CpaB
MSPRRLILILVAVLVSGITVFAARTWLKAAHQVQAVVQPQAPAAKPMPQVLVAKGVLPAGRFLRPDDLRWQPWPEEGIASNYIVDGQHRIEEFSGAVVRSGLSDGEPITDVRVVRPGDRGFMAAVLEPGKRAVTVPVTVSSGVAGFLFPGDYVDLILTFTVKSENTGPSSEQSSNAEHRASETLLTNIRVVAVDQRADDQDKTVAVAKTATLEVTPKEAEVIAVALSVGQISLSLRSLGDDLAADATKPFSHTWDSEATHLLPPPNAAGSTVKVSVFRASKVDSKEFPRSAVR